MTSDTVQVILDRLPSAKPAGPGKWSALCPVHEAAGNGHKPSLSIGQGDDGRALLSCMGGCATADVVKALGLTMADLFSDRPKAAHKPAPRTAAVAHRFDLPCLAAKAIARQVGGTLAGWWPYFNADDGEALTVLRFDLPGADPKSGKPEKTFRPIRPDGDGWTIGDPSGPLPLYRLAEINGEPRVYLFEGEKCADAAASIGLPATTSAHGAKSAGKSDWRPLRGLDVALCPDRDGAGENYVRDATARLTALTPPARVRIMRLPGLSDSDDLIEFIEARDAHTTEEIRGEIEALADAAFARPPDEIESAQNEAEHGVYVRLSDVTPQPVRFLWPGRIALGKLTIIAGNAGLGKSCQTLDLAARVTRGDGFPDCPASTSTPGGVVLLSAEDDLADTVRPRLDAAGAVVSRVLALTTIKRFDPDRQREVFESFNLATHLPILENGIAQVENCRAIFIDPLTAFLGKADSHNDAEVRGLLAPLADLAARHHVAVVGVMHLNKSGGDALARVMGSVGFVAAARAVYAVTKDRDDPSRRLFLPVKNNLGNDATGLAYRLVLGAGGVPRVVWDSTPVAVSADDAIAPLDQHRGPEPENREEAQSWLVDFLTSRPRPAEECLTEAAHVGITHATLRRAKAAAGVVAEKAGYGGPWTWRLPGHETPPQTAPAEGAHVAPVSNNLSIFEGT